MPKIRYKHVRMRKESLVAVAQATVIIEDYRAQGFDLSLRQLYYQFVRRNWISNDEKSYKRLGGIVNDGRLNGLLDWAAITDRTRNVRSLPHWEKPSDIINDAAAQYRVDKWEGQEYRVEVWVEKDALIEVVGQACNELDVPYFACRGYVSQSEMWAAAQRLIKWEKQGYSTKVYYLGDHDPSGIDMTRDIAERLDMFQSLATVHRIALSMDQIEDLKPPPNPAKTTDSRFQSYMDLYGEESWELDALEPQYLLDLITQHVQEDIDPVLWDNAVEREGEEREALLKAAKNLKV